MSTAMGFAGKTYQAGTLKYSILRLWVVFFWMLWVGFAMSLLGATFNTSTALLLRNYGMSDTFILVMIGSALSLMNTVMNPILSYRSDRCRSRLGRRIPFILYTAIPLGIAMSLMPYYVPLAGLLPAWNILGLSLSELLLAAGIIFYYFNWLFIGSIYFYLIPDVIPLELMGRYYGFFRVAGVVAGLIFSKFLFAWSVEKAEIIYPAVGAFYTLSILTAVFFIKEGQYPPLEDSAVREAWYLRLAKAVKSYITDCFSLPYYWWYFVAGTFFGFASCVTALSNFFCIDSCNMSLEQIGMLGFYYGVVGFVTCLIGGFLVDKVGGFQAALGALFCMAVLHFCNGLFMRDFQSALTWRLPLAAFMGIYSISKGKVIVEVFPRSRFGQFAAAQAMFSSLMVALMNYPVGKISDFMKNATEDTTLMFCGIDFMEYFRDYRYINYWSALFAFISFVLLTYFYVAHHKKREIPATEM